MHARVGAGMVNVIKDRKEKGELPEKFEKFVNKKGKAFPTVRSIVCPPPGNMVVEADYKTAEMVVLAYVSEDEVLKDFITGVDKNMALVRPDRVPDGINPEDVVVRLAFPDYIDSPPDKDKFLMTYSSDGVIHATFTEDDLLRDENGEIVHPGNDSHWQVCEVSRGTCREVMNKKKDRGAGKVVNQMRFLPAETPVSKCGELQGRPTWVICNRALFGGKAQRPSRKGVGVSTPKHRTPLGVMTWSALHGNVQLAKAGRGVANHTEHKVLQLLWRYSRIHRP